MVELCALDMGGLGEVGRFVRGWGGDTSNFTAAVARLGGKAGYMCRLGGDSFGSSFLELYRRMGVDASRIIVDPKGFTAVYFISLMGGGGHDFTYYRVGAAASMYSPDDLDLDYVGGAKALHGSGISLAISEQLREATLLAMRIAKESGAQVSFDINMRPKLWPIHLARNSCEEAFALSDVVFASMEDMKTLYGLDAPIEAAEKLRSMGVSTVVVKHGDAGCLVSSEEETFTSHGYKVQVLDTTGSGDAFDGGFVLATLEGWGARRAAAFANAVGAITATGLGAVAPLPTREQALRLIAEQDSR
jgi:2-dehydro-3-deoxygluconokinase